MGPESGRLGHSNNHLPEGFRSFIARRIAHVAAPEAGALRRMPALIGLGHALNFMGDDRTMVRPSSVRMNRRPFIGEPLPRGGSATP